MRITAVREISVPLETDVMRNGKQVTGYAFDSIRRYAQGGILRDRMIPRLMAAKPEDLLDASRALP